MKIEKFLSKIFDPLEEMDDEGNQVIINFLTTLRHWKRVSFSKCTNYTCDDKSISSWKFPVEGNKCENCDQYLKNFTEQDSRNFFSFLMYEFLARVRPYVTDKELFKKSAFAILEHPLFWDEKDNWHPVEPTLMLGRFKYLFLSKDEIKRLKKESICQDKKDQPK